MGKLDGKVAIIIGSTSGIGKCSAMLFAKEGADVIITGRRQVQGDQVVSEIAAAGGKAEFCKLDCSVTEECNQLVDYVVGKYGKLDILFYNAGVSTMDDPQEGFFEYSTPKLFDYLTQVNLKNAFFMSQKVMPELKKTKGNILFTTSGSGMNPALSMQAVIYGILKGGLNYAVKMLAAIGAPDGVRVNGVSPGITKTDILSQAPQEVVDQVTNAVPMKKMAMPEDLAEAALFLVSDSACSVTGQVLCVDNGQTI